MRLKNSEPILDTRRSNPNCFQSRYTPGQTRADMEKARLHRRCFVCIQNEVTFQAVILWGEQPGFRQIEQQAKCPLVGPLEATDHMGKHAALSLTDRRLDSRHRVVLKAARRSYPGGPPITALCPARIPPSAAASSKSRRWCRQVLI